MEIEHIEAFCEVARELSFTRAAANLHYAQSSITAKIKHLEDALGARLFERSSRSVCLTDAGRRLQPYAAELFELVAAIERNVPDQVPVGHGHRAGRTGQRPRQT